MFLSFFVLKQIKGRYKVLLSRIQKNLIKT